MTFQRLANDYLREFQRACDSATQGGAKSLEMATRPVVHDFIVQMVKLCAPPSKDLVVHHDINYTRTDRPDWRIEDSESFGIYCFGDHKNLSLQKAFTPTKAERSQFERYLSFGRPVFVFDGLELLVLLPGREGEERIELVPKSLIKKEDDWKNLPLNLSFEDKFRDLFDNPGFRKWSELDLINQLALRARQLSAELKFLLRAPSGSGKDSGEEELISSVKSLHHIIINHHDSSLGNVESCADFIAQVLTFGLFYAHTRFVSRDIAPNEKKQKIKEFWQIDFRDEGIDRLRPFLAIVEALTIPIGREDNVLSSWYGEVLGILAHAEYMGTKKGPRDFHILFENFLQQFDAKTRFDRGAFYTPPQLANWISKFCISLSERVFNTPLLSEDTRIIDPCCGTGSFMEALSGNLAGKKLESAIIGFEILPAPYALANYRMSQVFTNQDLDKIKIFLTDTLSDRLLEEHGPSSNKFAEELSLASENSQPPFMLVIGNPPSSNHTIESSPRAEVESLMEDFRPPVKERTDRQNVQKALNNEAYRFLRWSTEKVLGSSKGILALVLPGAFANAISFKNARRWLLERFDHIYVLEVDEDGRRADSTSSLFSVMQGRLVLIAAHSDSDSKGKLFHQSISHFSKRAKIEFLDGDPEFERFGSIEVDEKGWLFTESKNYPKDIWELCIPLISRKGASLFSSKCSALKLAPSAALFHTSKPSLMRRNIDLGHSDNVDKTVSDWFAGQRRPPKAEKFTNEVREALKGLDHEAEISRYNFRPFLNGWVLESDSLFTALAGAPGGGTRARPEIRKAFSEGAIGIALAPAPSDLGATLTRFASFCWNLPDNDIAARGNAMIYCSKFPKKSKGSLGPSQVNVSKTICDLFSEHDEPEKAAIFYIYGILSGEVYLDTFEGALYKPSDPENPPRIPILRDAVIRNQLVALGQQVAQCEQVDFSPSLDLALSWERDFEPLKLKSSHYSEAERSLVLKSDMGINRLMGVPPEAANLMIAGHNVIDKWLREKTFAYFRREFDVGEAEELKVLIRSIVEQQSLISRIDEILDRHLRKDCLASF